MVGWRGRGDMSRDSRWQIWSCRFTLAQCGGAVACRKGNGAIVGAYTDWVTAAGAAGLTAGGANIPYAGMPPSCTW